MNNADTIKKMYEAFGRGDLAAVLGAMSPDVDWDFNASTDLPWLKRRRGPEGVKAYFQALSDAFEIHAFRPKEILATPDESVVVALVDVGARMRKNGEEVGEEDEVHVFRFDAQGKVARFRHGIDSARHVAAAAKT